MSSFRDDAPPWSFFIPVTLAVIVGVLAADAIRYAIGTVFGGDDTLRQVEAAPDEAPVTPVVSEPVGRVSQAEPAPATATGIGTGRNDSADGPDAGPDAATPVVPALDETAATNDVQGLPDSMTARRDGDPAACVNGTVVNRVAGGWEQALENDAPVPCVIVNR